MNEMKECPDCKGKKGYEKDPNPYWLTDEEMFQPMEWVKCLTCDGEGKLSPLAYACRIAGGSQPLNARGYA